MNVMFSSFPSQPELQKITQVSSWWEKSRSVPHNQLHGNLLKTSAPHVHKSILYVFFSIAAL